MWKMLFPWTQNNAFWMLIRWNSSWNSGTLVVGSGCAEATTSWTLALARLPYLWCGVPKHPEKNVFLAKSCHYTRRLTELCGLPQQDRNILQMFLHLISNMLNIICAVFQRTCILLHVHWFCALLHVHWFCRATNKGVYTSATHTTEEKHLL